LFGQTFDFDHGVRRVALEDCRLQRSRVRFLSEIFGGWFSSQ
jgi:hypothetical protein